VFAHTATELPMISPTIPRKSKLFFSCSTRPLLAACGTLLHRAVLGVGLWLRAGQTVRREV
jgi:hypothetical protein